MEYFPFNSLFIDFTETLVHRILNLTKKETWGKVGKLRKFDAFSSPSLPLYTSAKF
jgi:hypothetical protein